MSPVMTFRIAFKALGRNKMRTGLTMLGMIIGVAAVITLVAMGNGAQSMIEDQIKGAGTNMITVTAGNFSSGGVRLGVGAASTLTEADADAIRRLVGGDTSLLISAIDPSDEVERAAAALVDGGLARPTIVSPAGRLTPPTPGRTAA